MKHINKFLISLALIGLSMSALAQSTYIITGSGTSFTVYKDGAPLLTNQPLQSVIDAVKINANGADCTIQFESSGNTLNTGDNSITFDGGTSGTAWGLITLTGKLTSTTPSANNGTIYLKNDASVSSQADIANTATGSAAAIYNDVSGTLTISGGTVKTTGDNAYPILNVGDGAINITGGTVEASGTSAPAIIGGAFSSLIGKITVSGDAVVTSKNTSAVTGTIIIADGNDATDVRLEITGGTVENTADNGIAVYNTTKGAVEISGGTVSTTTGVAVWNNNIGKITVSGTAKVTSARTGNLEGTIYLANNGTATDCRLEITGGTIENTATNRAVRNDSPGAIDISGGTVSATIGFAVWNDFIGKITVSGTAMVTSANSSGNGTIYLANKGTDTTVRLEITGGTVGNTASGGNAIFNASPGAIDISGGTVSVGGGCAVQNVRGTLNISGGTISATSGSAVFNSTAVSKATVNISGGTVSAAGGGSTSTVHTYEGTINISGGTISAINGVAVRCSGSDAEVTISGGTVSSSNSYAILNPYLSGTVTISGGMVLAAAEYAISGGSSTITLSSNAVVFAYGEDDEDVIDGTYTRSGDAVIVAWDEAQGTTTYNAYTSDDIYKLPTEATAVWEHQSGSGGIAYENGANTGFIPLAAVTVTGTTYLVTVTNGIGGGDYKAGDVVTITANAPPAGQQFKEWTTTPDLTFTSGTSETSPTATFTMPAEAVTATATFEVETGIVGATHALSLRVYPNPTAGKFTILDFRFDDLRVDDLQIEIYDVVGSLLQSKIVNLQSEIAVDISHLAAGLYFLKIDGKMFKVVKE